MSEATNQGSIGRISLAVFTCGTCLHWHDMGPPPLPNGSPNLSAPHQGECRERLRSAGVVQGGGGQLRLVAWLSGYPTIPVDFPACGQYEALQKLLT